jgi:hypothetical protein
MLEGAANLPCLVITHNQQSAELIKFLIRQVKGNTTGDTLSLPSVARGLLRGTNKPIAIDNASMHQLLRCLLVGIDELETKNSNLRKRNTLLSEKMKKIRDLTEDLLGREF